MLKNFIGSLLIIYLMLSMTGCSQDPHHEFGYSQKKAPIELPPIVAAGNPKVVNPDTCPPARCIAIPSTTGKYFATINGAKKVINLIPPEKKHADFFIGLQNYNTDKGLAQSSILCSYIDRVGNLWLGTDGGGVSCYNGKSFNNIKIGHGLANNSVYCITEDKSGNIWFGTNGGGVSRYDGRTFTTFTTAQGLANNSVHCITETNDSKLWMATNEGVSIFNGNEFIRCSASDELQRSRVACITQDKRGTIWLGTEDHGLFQFSNGSWMNYTTKQGLADNFISCIAEGKNGALWFGCGSGLTKFDGQTFTLFTTEKGLVSNGVTCIAMDEDENLWIGSIGGISMYDGTSIKTVATASDLLSSAVRCVSEDKAGNFWFGTYGGGLFLYSNSGCLTTNGLAGNYIYAIMEDQSKNVWFCTDGGVTSYDGTNFISYTTSQGLAENKVLSIAEDELGSTWFGTRNSGISCFNGKCFTTYTTANGLGDNTVWVITRDHSNNLWFGTDQGVTKYDGKMFSIYTTRQGLPNNKVRCITEDATGNIWFGTDGGGVCCYNNNSFTVFTSKQGLASNSIFSITKDKANNLWFGSAGSGISILSNSEIQKLKQPILNDSVKPFSTSLEFKNFTTKDSLANDVVYDIVENKKGDIIIGTNEGFTFLSGGYDLAGSLLAKNGIRYFNQKSGYPIKDINVNAMCVDTKDILWSGTGEKLIRFNYNSISRTALKPELAIHSIKLNNQNISWNDLVTVANKTQNSHTDGLSSPANSTEESVVFGSVLSDAKRDSMIRTFKDVHFDSIAPFNQLPINLVLPYQYNNITFDYAAIEPARPFLVRYQFMLEGYDENWNPVTERTSASYGNLFEGQYIFKLKAQSPEGIWSEPIRFRFNVLPPWYRAWWAYSLYAVLFFATLITYINWSKRKLKKEKKILEDKIEERTHELTKEKYKSENLLLNILPHEIAEELKETGTVLPKYFDEATVMFTDFKSFTIITEKLSPEMLVTEIDSCFKAFDHIIGKYNIEKIKTIGDSYMCAGGLPVANKTSAVDVVCAALEIRQFMKKHLSDCRSENKESFEIRIGIHTGPVVAGIVGVKKFAYDIWGDTVNIASRMESSGEAGKINISGSTYELVKDKFNCNYRGKIQAKNKGEIDMYFVEGIK